MKARRRILIVSLCVLLFVAAVAIVVLLRKRAAPEAARLLPEADAVVYIDFATVRNLTQLDQQQLPRLAPGYEEFVKQTDFSFERDLDEAAMAVHRGAPGSHATRYSEILIGHYDQGKVAAYLRQRSRSVDTYRNVEVFSVPIENRTLRIALLTIDTVAISNVDDPGVLHGIIDRFKKVALPFGGPRLVRTYFPKVPLGSLMWTVAHLPAGAQGQHAAPSFTLPGGIDIGLPSDSDVVVSLRMLTTIHARADFYTPSEDAARTFADQSNAFLALFRSIQASAAPGPADADVKAVFDSIKIAQKGDRTEVTATIPPTFLKKLAREPATVQEGGAQAQPPAPQPPPPTPNGKKKKH
jgi:hypothetical protein